jgi:hypothetical protein
MAKDTERYLPLALAMGIALWPGVAGAQATSAAQVSFDEGRRLMEAGDYAAACAKLAESERLDPAAGTLMNLAACHARQGRTATAWAEYTDGLALARRDGRQDRIVEATRQLAELAPRLGRLSLVVDAALPGMDLLLDGTALGPASWGTAFPVDPGEHAVLVRAPGRITWTTHVSVGDGKTTAIQVPPLQLAPPDGPPVPVAPPPSPGRPVSALVVSGVALAAIGIGATFGLLALSEKDASKPHCTPTGDACTQGGASLLREANTYAWVSDVGFGVGAAAIGTAAYLFLSHSRATEPARAKASLFPMLGPGSLGLGAGGSW